MHGKIQPPPGMQLPSPHSQKRPEEPRQRADDDRRQTPFAAPLPSPHPRRPEDDRRHPRPFGAAGRSLLLTTPGHFDCRSSESPPPSAGPRSESRMDEEDAIGETNYRDQMRAQLKTSACLLAADHRYQEANRRRPEAKEEMACNLPPEFQPPTPRRRTSKGSARPSAEAQQSPSPLPALSPLPAEEVSRGEGAAALARAKSDAKARMSACYEDLISFLEMNGLCGAYALAFAGAGVQDLSQLLLLEDEELEVVIRTSDMDAMDEILLRDALAHSRPPK